MAGIDAVVVGAGPGGCAAAIALAAGGASVRVLDPRAPEGRGLSGEWLHPGGVAALDRLGVSLSGPGFVRNHGFLVHPGDGTAPITLPYPQGSAVSMHHSVLTRVLRQAVTARPEVMFGEPDRVLDIDRGGTVRTTRELLSAGLVVGADGRSSAVRRALRPDEPPSAFLSDMAGLLLRDVALPVEGFSHVFLGGPGPVLAYRVATDTVRVCFDVPRPHPRPPEVYSHLVRGYLPSLAEPLQDGCRTELVAGRVRWAANRFRRRAFYGRGRHVLVGDAAGFGHPLAALGMSLAILDGESLAHCGSSTAYARQRARRAWSAERLAAATHRAFTASDPASLALRNALFTLWRGDPRERKRMMALLGLQDHTRRGLAGRVARIARTAAAEGPLLGLGAWLYWLTSLEMEHTSSQPRPVVASAAPRAASPAFTSAPR